MQQLSTDFGGLNSGTTINSNTTRIEMRLRLPVVWLSLLLLAALFVPDRIWNTFLIGFGGMFIIAYLWVRLLAQGLQAQRHLRFGWVAVGDRLSEAFQIVNHSPVPALWIEVMDQSNVPGYQAGIVRSVGAGEVDRWKKSAICQQRGQFCLGPWSLRSSDPFGIFMLIQEYPFSNEIIIHPPVHGELPVSLPAGQSSGRQQVRQRAWQATVNAATIREYRHNDPLNWIHWPTSARQNRLLVRQFDLDVSGDIWLLLDMATAVQLGQGASGTEEHTVLLAASLAARALQQNRAVGLAGYGQQPQVVPPGRGQGQQWRILRALALVKADGITPLTKALSDLSRVAQRGTTAVLITSDMQPDWFSGLVELTRSGVQSHVILLDRASFGGKGDGLALRDMIRRLGFDCDIVRQGEVGRPLVEQERRGFWEFRVTATGKVVVLNRPEES